MDSQCLGEAIGPKGRYVLVRFLCQGSFGKVMQAYDTVANEHVAIKFMQRGPQLDSTYLIREIKNHRTLCHAHVICFKEVFLTDQHLCIVMEYAPGGDMYKYITKHKCLREDWARWFFQQLIVGIEYCHKRGVVMRDIKLENILLDEKQQLVKLCDFGFSKHKHSIPPVSMVGTPSYLAPEILMYPPKCKPYDGQKVDIWTLGVSLFVMLYGYYPFDDPSDTSNEKTRNMLQRIATGKVIIPENQDRTTSRGTKETVRISDGCRDLLARVLDPNPANRITLEGIMDHKWFKERLPDGVLNFNKGVEHINAEDIARRKRLQPLSEIEQLVEEATSTPYRNFRPMPGHYGRNLRPTVYPPKQ